MKRTQWQEIAEGYGFTSSYDSSRRIWKFLRDGKGLNYPDSLLIVMSIKDFEQALCDEAMKQDGVAPVMSDEEKFLEAMKKQIEPADQAAREILKYGNPSPYYPFPNQPVIYSHPLTNNTNNLPPIVWQKGAKGEAA